jgi:sec-independent protein translocase protein TatA
MPNIGAPELIVILVIALLILGPGKLPEVGASIGKSIREFRKASSDIEDSVKVNVETSPLPPTPAPAAPAAPVEAPVPQPAVAAHAADLPGAPTVATTPAANTPTSESTASSN